MSPVVWDLNLPIYHGQCRYSETHGPDAPNVWMLVTLKSHHLNFEELKTSCFMVLRSKGIYMKQWNKHMSTFWRGNGWVKKKNTLPETNQNAPKMMVSNRNLLFHRSIFSGYISFRECIWGIWDFQATGGPNRIPTVMATPEIPLLHGVDANSWWKTA